VTEHRRSVRRAQVGSSGSYAVYMRSGIIVFIFDRVYPADTLLAMLRDLSEQLPDEGLVLLKDVEDRGMARDVLAKLLDGLAAQCSATKRKLGIALRTRQ
jgi:hypothetical protein